MKLFAATAYVLSLSNLLLSGGNSPSFALAAESGVRGASVDDTHHTDFFSHKVVSVANDGARNLKEDEICESVVKKVYTVPAKVGKNSYWCFRIELQEGGRLYLSENDPKCKSFANGSSFTALYASNYEGFANGLFIFGHASLWHGQIQVKQDLTLSEAKLELVGKDIPNKLFELSLTVPKCKSIMPSAPKSPSAAPSIIPSSMPSESSLPSASPSSMPSSMPSESSLPSASPSSMPSAVPSLSSSPTGVPSSSPSETRRVERCTRPDLRGQTFFATFSKAGMTYCARIQMFRGGTINLVPFRRHCSDRTNFPNALIVSSFQGFTRGGAAVYEKRQGTDSDWEGLVIVEANGDPEIELVVTLNSDRTFRANIATTTCSD